MFDSEYVRDWCIQVQEDRKHPRTRQETKADFNYQSVDEIREMFRRAYRAANMLDDEPEQYQTKLHEKEPYPS